MKTLLVDGLQDSNTPKTTVSYIKSEIDNTITHDGLLIISFHNIVDTTPSYNEEYLTSDFKQISDYLKSRSDAVDVVSMSDYFFSVTPTPTPTETPTPTPSSIEVKYPNGGETLYRGNTYTISWSNNGNPGPNVKIELLKGGSLSRVISSSTPNDGTYSWSVFNGQSTGSNYKIRIISTSDNQYQDTSDENFTIIKR
jgi:hypothetical protein